MSSRRAEVVVRLSTAVAPGPFSVPGTWSAPWILLVGWVDGEQMDPWRCTPCVPSGVPIIPSEGAGVHEGPAENHQPPSPTFSRTDWNFPNRKSPHTFLKKGNLILFIYLFTYLFIFASENNQEQVNLQRPQRPGAPPAPDVLQDANTRPTIFFFF